MTAAAPPPRLISLEDVVERRFWCPFSGNRVMTPDGSFAVNSSCIGPRCTGWRWRCTGDSVEAEHRRCHLVPPHFSPDFRIRLAAQTLPDLVEPLQALARGDGDLAVAREAILARARSDWKPEQELPEPDRWKRAGEIYWDSDADTAALDLVRVRTDEQRLGFCGISGPGR